MTKLLIALTVITTMLTPYQIKKFHAAEFDREALYTQQIVCPTTAKAAGSAV